MIAEPAPSGCQDELRWTVHPAGEHPAQGLAVGAVILVAALLCWRASGSSTLATLALTFLAVSLRAFFLPRRYRLDAEGASEWGPLCQPRTLTWDAVRRVSSGQCGLHLSLLHSTSRLVPDRGLFLRAPGRRQQVADFVRRHVSCP